MLPLMAMVLQAGILSRQNAMLQRQNNLTSEVHTRLNERDEKLSADTFLADINEGYVEESDASDNDSYSEMPLLEDPTDGDPASTANSYLGMTSNQLRYYEEFFINKELDLAKKRELYESQRAHLQKELEQFINYPTDTSNRSDCIEHASYIINLGRPGDR